MSYTDRQQERDTSYARAYREWVASLPPEERATLDATGLATPDASRHTSTREGDALRLMLAPSTDHLPGDLAEDDPASTPPSADTTAADVLASFCARIRSHPNPLLAFDAACFASGLMDVEGLSESDLAKRHRVSRAGFSKLVVQWSETFGLPPSRGMRSTKARRACRKARLTHLAKHHDRSAA